MLNQVVLSLGSNRDKENNIELADRLLREYFVSIHFSEAVYTEPVGMLHSSLFLNQVAMAYSPEGPDEIIKTLKQIERKIGRLPEDKAKELIPIDIDLLQWNNEVLKPIDMQRPYIQSALLRLSGARQKDERSNR